MVVWVWLELSFSFVVSVRFTPFGRIRRTEGVKRTLTTKLKDSSNQTQTYFDKPSARRRLSLKKAATRPASTMLAT